MKERIHILGPIFIIVLLIIIYLVSPFAQGKAVLRQGNDKVRAHILKIVPLGTDKYVARQIVRERTLWDIRRSWDDRTSTEPNLSSHQESASIESTMEVYLGEYSSWILINTCVGAVFEFDENGKLTDVVVSRDYDSL